MRFALVSFFAACCAVMAASAFAPARLEAQSFGIYHSLGRSDLAELGAASGVGAFVRLVPHTALSLRVGYHRHSETAHRVGEVCNNYVIYFMCSNEGIETATRVQGGAVTAAWLLRPVAPVALEIGGGVSLNDVHGTERTESGRPSSLFSYQSAQVGLLAIANGRVRPVRALPVTIEAGVANHFLLLRACANDPRRYSPYCGDTSLREFRIGIGYDMR